MAYIRCGGGGNSKISKIKRLTEQAWFVDGSLVGLRKYEVVTVSTGGGDATVRVIQYDENDTVLQSVDILYTNTPQTIGDVKVQYNSYNALWVLYVADNKKVNYNGTTYTAGETVNSWSYTNTVDLTNIIAEIRAPFSPKKNDEIYLVTNSDGVMVREQYQGADRILRKGDISAYAFYYEDLVFPSAYHNNYQPLTNYCIDSGFSLYHTDNVNRDWQIEFNVHAVPNNVGGDIVVVGNALLSGSQTRPSNLTEIYLDSSNDLIIGLVSETNVGNAQDKDVVIRKVGTTITVTIDGTEVYNATFPYTTGGTGNDEHLFIGNYRNTYVFSGIINYIGFKWLT